MSEMTEACLPTNGNHIHTYVRVRSARQLLPTAAVPFTSTRQLIAARRGGATEGESCPRHVTLYRDLEPPGFHESSKRRNTVHC